MQTASTIDPLVLRELHPGEQLLWWARPDARKRVTRTTNVSPLLVVLVVLLSISIAFLVTDAFTTLPNFISSGPTVGDFLAFFVVLFICMQYIFLFRSNSFDPRRTRLLRNTVYAITNQRIIVITMDKTYNVISETPDQIGRIDRLERSEGWGDIIYGIERPVRVGKHTVARRAALVSIPDVRSVEVLLVRTFKQPSYTPLPARQETYGGPAAPYTRSYPHPQE